MENFELQENELRDLLKISVTDDISQNFTDNLMDKIELSVEKKKGFKTAISNKPAIIILVYLISIIVIPILYKFANIAHIQITLNLPAVLIILLFIASASFAGFVVSESIKNSIGKSDIWNV